MELEEEVRKLKAAEKDRIRYTEAERIAAEWPYMLSGDKIEKLNASSISSGNLEFGYDQYGFPCYGFDYGNGGVSYLASKTDHQPSNKKLADFHLALENFGQFIRTGYQRKMTESERRQTVYNLIESLDHTYRVYKTSWISSQCLEAKSGN